MSSKKVKKERICFRVSYEEKKFIENLSKSLGINESELCRKILKIFKEFIYEDVKLSDVLKFDKKTLPILIILDNYGDISLREYMKPFCIFYNAINDKNKK